MKRVLTGITVIFVVSVLAVGTGCAKKPVTAQYQAALGNDDFAIALNGLCTSEINFKQSMDVATHQAFQKVCLQAATIDKQVTAALKAGDFTSAKSYLQSIVALLNGITPDMVNVKDPTAQQAMKTAVAVAVGIAQSWVNTLSTSP